MYLLYLDESGNPDDASDRYFVLGGLAIFERRTYWMQQEMELIKATHFPAAPPLDFHAQPIRGGKGFWRRIDPELRVKVLQELGRVIAKAPQAEWCYSARLSKKRTRFMVKKPSGSLWSRFASDSTHS